MSIIFWKNFQLCFSSKIMKPSPPSLNPPSKQDHSHPSTTTSIFIKNLNYLYDHHHLISSSDYSKPLSAPFTDTSGFLSSTSSSSSSFDESDAETPPDFAAVFASQRFFFSSPGRSNSIIESPDTRAPELADHQRSSPPPLNGGVAVKKYSSDPYSDFRCSMQEMIEARNLRDVKSEWEFLHELLFCYLTLNPKHTHKFIISAFADILVSLLSSSSPSSMSEDSHRKPDE